MIGTDMSALFAPELSPFISTIISEGRFGICKGLIRIEDVNTGCSTPIKTTPEGNMDRFSVILPYAGCSIKWEILFNSLYPQTPPDFIFDADDVEFAPDIDNLQNLVDWCPSDPECLLKAIHELLSEYREYHYSLLKQHSRLTFEYESLMKEYNLSSPDIEVHVTKKGEHRIGPINFLIKLPVDFSRIPAYLTKDKPGDDVAVLLVTFQSPECSKVTPQLYLSPRIEDVLGDSSVMRIPPYLNGGCLIDYLPSVCDLLKNKVDQVAYVYEKRRDYVHTFLTVFGRSVVEYDTEAFTHINFLFEWHDFFFNLGIDLSSQFPSHPPTLTFQSVYHEEGGGRPYTKIIKDYPYSPRWSANEMAERLRTYLLEYIPAFQRGSVTEGSL
ncbi:hypothetical protein LSH36_382g03000 [Paralvinella palmiformis]|uniref:BRISC and BRCA1-A complex member 2 n=1 Tax=Paralvinella palmiformis TaxID=53620 RepID=A0AAD9JDL7_9ANNE|nr:hypothetical protein LSH36_382g03000 [Paralvinella palmiformis]